MFWGFIFWRACPEQKTKNKTFYLRSLRDQYGLNQEYKICASFLILNLRRIILIGSERIPDVQNCSPRFPLFMGKGHIAK